MTCADLFSEDPAGAVLGQDSRGTLAGGRKGSMEPREEVFTELLENGDSCGAQRDRSGGGKT